MTARKVIFITGASRSGTTLLSFVLRNHPEIFGLKELQYFGQVWDPRDARGRLARAEAVEAVAAMLATQEFGVLGARITPEHRLEGADIVDGLGDAGSDPAVVFAAAVHGLAHKAGKSVPCEQTPRYIYYARALLDRYPAAKVIHIVRDPRAVMASQKKRWQRRRLAAEGATVSRYQSARVWVNYHPYTVARLWTRATSEALALAEHPRFTVIRFEDLVQQPRASVQLLCDRLGVGFDERMLDVRQINSSHQSSVGGARRGLHADAIDRWRDVLTPAERFIAERRCGQLMRRFGYASDAGARITPVSELGYGLSYLAHLGGVMLVNPRRAWIQGMALSKSRGSTIPSSTSWRDVATNRDRAE